MRSLIFTVLLSTSAHAGWTSSGGELVKDSANPWFIQNTTDVSYCINLDPLTFHQSIDTVDEKIQLALKYWKEEFVRSFTPSINGVKIEVATQVFTRGVCTPNTDITFQMGVLSNEQKRYLIDPTNFVAAAIRTDYDPVTLRGKGFVYVAPDSGPLKPSLPNPIANPWIYSNGELLYRVLVHELGHVFGIKHSSGTPVSSIYSGKSLMSSSYPEYLLQEGAILVHFPEVPHYFANVIESSGTVAGGTSCSSAGLHDRMIRFFGIPRGWECYELTYENGVIRLFAQASVTSPLELIGTATITGKEEFHHLEQAVTSYLTEKQQVFPSWRKRELVIGPYIKYVNRKGFYKSEDGQNERPIVVNMPLNEVFLSISGELDGEIIANLFAVDPN